MQEISTKVPREAPAVRGRHECKETAGFISHTFVLRYSNLPESVFGAGELSLRSTLFFKQIFEVAVTLRFHLFVRYKAQRGAVDAVAHAVGGFRVPGKDVPEVGVPGAAADLGAVQAVAGEKGEYPCRAAVLATGGVSYPGTGSTGDGYRIAGELGHTIVAPHGSLVPLVSEDTCCGIMQGLALKNVQLTAVNEKKKTVFSEFGEMLFTHFGVSGPLVLSASAHLRDWDKHTYSLSIDLKPALSEEKLEERLLRELREQSNRNMENVLLSLVPTSMVPVLCTRLHIDPELKANSFKKEQRRALLQELKHFTLSVSGPRPVAEAIVTSGGVKVGEVNPGTMESKLITGLYFAGEILDVDAYTGGFNLQIAWSTGRAAGLAAAEEEGER